MSQPLKYDQKPNTKIADSDRELLQEIKARDYAVLVGRNNSGKSFILKSIRHGMGEKASYLGPARYQNFNVIGSHSPRRDRRRQEYQQFTQQWTREQQNVDNSPLNLQQAIAELSDKQRDTLIEIVGELLGTKMEILDTVPGNSMSQKYVSCDGHNISFTSSGYRLIITLITSLLSDDCEYFLIDEPELGISPEAQGIFADFVFDRNKRAKYFPHIKGIVFATHSTVFLDRHEIGNNYVVDKVGDDIRISRAKSPSEFNNIHFFLLGNRFETLFLPSSIVFVEGKTDHKFISRVISLKFPNSQVSVISANSDSRIKEYLNMTKGILSDLQKSPYRDRIFAVLDAVHSATLPDELSKMGVERSNIITWSENGIEHYYPEQAINKIFGGSAPLTIDDDVITCNGLSLSKNELADKVVELLDSSTVYLEEFQQKLLKPLSSKL